MPRLSRRIKSKAGVGAGSGQNGAPALAGEAAAVPVWEDAGKAQRGRRQKGWEGGCLQLGAAAGACALG